MLFKCNKVRVSHNEAQVSLDVLFVIALVFSSLLISQGRNCGQPVVKLLL